MTDEEAARLRAQVHEATRVLSGSYTIPQARQAALTEEYAETFAAAVERLLDERAALVALIRSLVDDIDNDAWVWGWQTDFDTARALLAGKGEQRP